MGQSYLLDSNVIIDYIGELLPESALDVLDNILNAGFNTSIISKIEVLGFDETPQKTQQLEKFLNTAQIFIVDEIIATKTIELRKQIKKLKLGDAIIAATALVFDMELITRNTSDFKNIRKLKIVNSWELK